MVMLHKLLIGVVRSAIWPAYLALAAYAARQAPWPKDLALPTATILAMLALAALVANLVRRLFGPCGWAEDVLEMPPEVSCQVRRALVTLVAIHVVLLLPAWVITLGLIAPEGRPTPAPAVVRGLILVFEVGVLLVAWRLLRSRSALIGWVTQARVRLGVLARHQRALSITALAGIASVIVLDARGYSFSARRLATGAAGSVVIAAVCWVLYRILIRCVDNQAWRWVKVGQGRSRRADSDAGVMPDDLAARLRHLSAYLACGVGLVLASWVWDVDLALFQFIAKVPLWSSDGVKDVWVTAGDLTKAMVVMALCAMAWRHMSTFFAVVVFPRIPDDPGIRYAVVTLCRYAVLGVGLLWSLSAIHMGLEKIGVGLAALGVGLGFGLQEIVSNFVCGIILLLERPIRVGDTVTVGGQTGRVDRINIRATTMTNGDNQSMIIPNRAFITGDLVNWTLKDKILRVSVSVKVAYGTDPDAVSELLLAIARDDDDVLHNPAPSALMQEISDSSLIFTLYAHVPEPSLGGQVRHRLFRQIQQRFKEAGIRIPVPVHEMLLKPTDQPQLRLSAQYRADTATQAPPGLWSSPPRPAPEPVADCNRCVDE